jgi:hypothetical protein
MILDLSVVEELDNFKFTEDNVDEYVALCHRIFSRNKTKKTRVIIPEKFDTILDQRAWEREEVRRCIQGYDGMCGKMYFYFNYCYIINISGGFIQPQFRVCDSAWFELIESTKATGKLKGHGIVCVKRRRAGFSWKAAADALHDALFSKGASIGMDSKTERDSQELFKKCKQIYDKLPSFFRVPTGGGQTKESMYFARKVKDEHGTYRYTGNMSELFCVPPTDSAYEGRMMTKWVSDEAGKKSNLMTMWGFTEDCLNEETERKGQPIIFGTSGDVDSNAKGLKEFWYKHDAYKFVRFFMAGWMGMDADDLGNDRIKKQVEGILAKRKAKLDSGALDYWDYVQKYPLTPKEAFLQKEGTGVGVVKNIKEQIYELEKTPVKATIGGFRWGNRDAGEAEVVFEPNSSVKEYGKCVVYEHPSQSLSYSSGCDPADHDYVSKRASDMSTYIMNKPRGTTPPRVVFSFTDRPEKVDSYYEQVAMALIYYNHTKILIENNRFGMIKWFELSGFVHLMKMEPVPKATMNRKFTPRIGIRKNEATAKVMERCINEYTNDYCNLIPELDLLEEFFKYGEENTDRVIAFGWTLVSLEDDMIINKGGSYGSSTPIKPNFGMKRINGRIQRYKN